MSSRFFQARNQASVFVDPKKGKRDRWQHRRSSQLGRIEERKLSHASYQSIPLQPLVERQGRDRNVELTARHSSRLRQQQRHRERQRLQAWEVGVALTLTVVWASMALAGFAKLRPVQQETHKSLATLSSEVEQLQTRVNRAWRKVELGLDSTQSETAIRESLNYVPFNQLGVVFEEPATPRE